MRIQKETQKVREEYPELKSLFVQADRIVNTLKQMAVKCEKLKGDKKG